MVRRMSAPIRRVAVLGAGVMGSGIAAHVANAGLPVLLLDIVPPDKRDDKSAGPAVRNAFAAGAIKQMLKGKPASFFHPSRAKLISVGNLEDDLEKAAECDLIIEAIIERLDIKQALFTRLEKLIADRGEDAIVASNTSGLRIKDMLEGRSDAFKQRFCIMHFFNPPRYMKLLELVSGEETSSETLERVENFGREMLGKGIVYAKDCPNFIANRIGVQSMMTVMHTMLEMNLAPEDVDAITGIPMGHPKSATFRTGDLVGLDTLNHVVRNCYESLTEDEQRDTFKVPPYIETMIERKQLGNKTKGGFYKKTKAGIETLDPKTGEYRARGGDQDIRKKTKDLANVEDVRERVKKLAATEGVIGEFAWKTTAASLAYAANRVGEISDSVAAIDDGMKWGYNWELGPFEIWDALGFAETTDRLIKEGYALPDSVIKMKDSGVSSFYSDGRVFSLVAGEYISLKEDAREITWEVMRKSDAPVLSNNGAEAWDLGDGILGVRFKTKMNSIDPDVISMLHEASARAERDFEGMLVSNGGEHFCVGANLMLVVMAAGQKDWAAIGKIVSDYQAAVQRMRYASVPVIGVPYGMTLGGGLELCFGCDAVQAAAETYSGLVEVGVGLIPGGAGTMNMLWRAFEGIPDGAEVDSYAIVTQVFKNIAMADVATSADAGKMKGYFRHSDGVSFDRARQIWEAKQRAIGLAKSGYHPPQQRSYKLPGSSGIATLTMMVNTLVSGGYASEHDAHIANKLAHVLCGGEGGASREVTESEVLELEREAFVSLCGETKSQERMQHMLMKNKPLRN